MDKPSIAIEVVYALAERQKLLRLSVPTGTTVREAALRHDMYATFMAKPIAGQAGSSMHLHQSVVDAQGRNVFSQPDGSASEAFFHFIGGLQAYTPDLMLIYAPTVNSYRRYVAPSLIPI